MASLKPGMWDFTVEVPVPGRNNRTSFPLRENKVAEVRKKDWPKTLRVALAKVVNRHLAAAGVKRRVSPETYKEMGILADPQEGLRSKRNYLETQGVATQIGVANEKKQWAAVQAAAKQEYDAALFEADARINRLVRSQSADAKRAERLLELRERLHQAAKLRHDAFIIDQEIERAKSRAVMVRERNLRMLNAAKADLQKAKSEMVDGWKYLIGTATLYLQALDEKLVPELMAATRWRREAMQLEEQADTIETELTRAREPTRAVASRSPVESPQRSSDLPAAVDRSTDADSKTALAEVRDPDRREAELHERLQNKLVQRQREREAAGRQHASDGLREINPKPNPVKPQTRQSPPHGFDFGR